MTLYESATYKSLLLKEAKRLDKESFKDKKVLVTGGTGMVGSFITDILLFADASFGLGTEVTITTRHIEKAVRRFAGCPAKDMLKAVEWDAARMKSAEGLKSAEELKSVAEQKSAAKELKAVTDAHYDFYIHCASTTHPKAYSTEPIATMTANLFGAYVLLEAAARDKGSRLAFLSSVEVYGENKAGEGDFAEKDMGYIDCNTLRAGYPEAKRAGEALCMAYAEEKGCDTVIPRLARTYGPTQLSSDTKAVSQFIKKALNREDIVLKSSGTQTYSYCFVADAASAVLHLLAHGRSNEAVNVLSPDSDISLKALSEKLAGLSGKKVIYELPEETEKKGYSTATRATLSGELLRERGFDAGYTIDEGMKLTLKILDEIGGYTV